MDDKNKKVTPDDVEVNLDNLSAVTGGTMKEEIITNETTDISQNTRDKA